MTRASYGQLKQKITFSLTPYCIAQLWLLSIRNRRESISDTFEQLVRGKISINREQPTDEEIITFMLRYKPKEFDDVPREDAPKHFRNIYFNDHSARPNTLSELI